MHCGQLILRKISKFVTTRCHILRLKCTKFDFRCSSAPHLAGELIALPKPLAVFKGPTSKGREGMARWGEGEAVPDWCQPRPVAIICPSPLTYARQRLITATQSSRYDMLAIFNIPLSIRPIFIFCCRSYVKLLDYWRAEKIFSTSGGPPEARGICHICHMVNPALRRGSKEMGKGFAGPTSSCFLCACSENFTTTTSSFVSLRWKILI